MAANLPRAYQIRKQRWRQSLELVGVEDDGEWEVVRCAVIPLA